MNPLSRRIFLLRSISLSAAAAVPATAMIVSAARAEPAENPALLALGGRIDPLLKAFRIANEHKISARLAAEASDPPVPAELVISSAGDLAQFHNCYTDAEDIEGKWIAPELFRDDKGKRWVKAPTRILRADPMRERLAEYDHLSKRSKIIVRLRRLIETAEQYEADRRAVRASLDKAIEYLYEATCAVDDLVWQVAEIEPSTPAGVLIYARVIQAHHEVEITSHPDRPYGGTMLGVPLAAAILRNAGRDYASVA